MTVDVVDLPVVQAPTRPSLVGPPVFFMHIAKTAGSYLNAVLETALAKDQLAQHVEHRLGRTEDLQAILGSGATVVSGHVMHGLWDAVSAPLAQPFRKITVLRDPIEHLASHLLWLDHYTMAEYRAGYRRLDEAHQRVVDRIATVDLSDIGQLDHYLTTLGATEVRLFDNCQSRYFLGSGRRDPEACRTLTLADAKAVKSVAETFDLILCQDRLEADLGRLSRLLDVPLTPLSMRINEAKSARRIDVANPLVRQVLSKRVLLDQWLWRGVRST